MRQFVLAFAAMGLLAACNSTSPTPPAPETYASAPPGVTPESFRLPQGTGCSGDVARLEAIIDNDLETGHIGASVHKAMKDEIAKASSACAADQEAQASAMIAATRKRHGYPAG